MEHTLDTASHARTAAPPEPPPASGPSVGDPTAIGVPTFVVGSIALGLVLVGFVPPTAVGASIAIILAATGVGQGSAALWAAALGQNAVAAVFGIFAGFWFSYAALVLGLTHGWYGITPAAAVSTQGLFLISWLVTIVVLTLATLRLPAVFTLLFTLIDLALVLVLLGTLSGTAGLVKAGGFVVFAFVLVGLYLFVHTASLATGGKGLPLGTPVRRG